MGTQERKPTAASALKGPGLREPRPEDRLLLLLVRMLMGRLLRREKWQDQENISQKPLGTCATPLHLGRHLPLTILPAVGDGPKHRTAGAEGVLQELGADRSRTHGRREGPDGKGTNVVQGLHRSDSFSNVWRPAALWAQGSFMLGKLYGRMCG